MQKKVISLALIGCFFCSTSLYADGIQQLNAFNSQINNLSGDFSQVVKNNKGSKKTQGSFSISRPKYFKWEYKQPYKQLIVGDGNIIWMYDTDLAQVIKKKQDVALGQSPVAVLADKNALEKYYNIKNAGNKNGIDYIMATPKTDNSGYQYIKIGFKNNQLASMDLKDSFGSQSIIEFKNLSVIPINKKAYNFVVPKNVDVLEE